MVAALIRISEPPFIPPLGIRTELRLYDGQENKRKESQNIQSGSSPSPRTQGNRINKEEYDGNRGRGGGEEPPSGGEEIKRSRSHIDPEKKSKIPRVLGGLAAASGLAALFSYTVGDKFIENQNVREFGGVTSSIAAIFFGSLFAASKLSTPSKGDNGIEYHNVN